MKREENTNFGFENDAKRMKVAFFIGVNILFREVFYVIVREISEIFSEKMNFISEKIRANKNVNGSNHVETNLLTV